MGRLSETRQALRDDMAEDRLLGSLLGQFGTALEPVTRLAGFDWKINIALLSSFTARENSVATLGVLYDQPAGENRPLAERMAEEQRAAGFTALTGAAILLFFALYPPCMATVIVIRIQTGSTAWSVFSIVFPTLLGLGVAIVTYSGGWALGLTGLEMMTALYGLALTLLLIVGVFKAPFGRTLPRPGYRPREGGAE